MRTAEESLVRAAVQVVEDDLPHGVGGGVEAVVGVSVGREDSVEVRDQTGGELGDCKERVISSEMLVVYAVISPVSEVTLSACSSLSDGRVTLLPLVPHPPLPTW